MPPSEPGLLRAVSRWQVVALALNDVVGSGVYLLPAATAALLGWHSVGAVGLAGLATLLIVLCFAEAGSRFAEPGSAYLYARTAFGPLAGFEVGWMTWLARVTAAAALLAGLAQALTAVWPGAGSPRGRTLTITLALGLLTAVNVRGVTAGVRTAVALTLVKLAPLLLFVAAGSLAFEWPLARAQRPTSPGGLGEGALLLLFAYAGFENTAAAAGEYRRPRRDVPFALLAQVGLVTVLYTAVQVVALGTLPDLGGSRTPLADAARRVVGPWAGGVLSLGAAVSILGTLSNTVLAGPRYLFAMARDGLAPAWLGRVHPRFRTPAAAILAQSALSWPLALTGSFAGLAALSVIARLVTYLGTAAAVPFLRRRADAGEGAFELPGGPMVPLAAAALTLAFAAAARPADLLAGGAALLAGAVVFALRRRIDP